MNRPTRRITLSLVLCSAIAGAGCSKANDDASGKPTAPAHTAPAAAEPRAPAPAPAPRPLDACALMPLADAQVVAGIQLQPGITGTPDEPKCSYSSPPTGTTAQVEIYTGAGAEKILAIDRQLAHAFTPIADLGDEAVAEDDAVFFRKGAPWVAIVLVRLNDPAENRAPLLALAHKVAARM